MVTIYTTQTCAFCPMVKKFLEHRGVEFTTVDITNDPATRQALINETNAMTVPIVKRGDRFVVGWNPAKLAQLVA